MKIFKVFGKTFSKIGDVIETAGGFVFLFMMQQLWVVLLTNYLITKIPNFGSWKTLLLIIILLFFNAFLAVAGLAKKKGWKTK